MSTDDLPPRSPPDDRAPDGAAVGADGTRADRHNRLGRRTFVKGLGAAGATAVGLSHDRGAAQDAEAIVPLVGYAVGAAAISAVGGIGVGWTLREYEVIGSNPPPEGLTPDALKQQLYQAARTRKSTNSSTIVDNRNILDGVKHNAYTEAKIAAIEELNAGSSESEVLDAATAAINSYAVTVETNFLKSWNEAVNEFYSFIDAVETHPDLSPFDVLTTDGTSERSGSSHNVDEWYPMETFDVTLADESTFELNRVAGYASTGDASDYESYIDAVDGATWGYGTGGEPLYPIVTNASGDSVEYLIAEDWKAVWDEMQTKFQNVRDGISTWVTSVYGDVQSGDIEVSDLVTPKERAAMMAEEEGMSQAIADLIALNIPVDPEREATITIGDTGATLPGTFALTDESDGPLEAGTTYDPSTFSGDIYFNTDMSLVEGPWDAINTSVDGGTITITAEPYEGTAIEVTTTAGETVTVPAADWSAVDGSTEWTYDASDGLETPITEVDSARFHATATETQYETLQLRGSFTVDKLTNTQTGEEVDSTSFENSEPQNDSNYITQEEWDDLQSQNEKLIEKYENQQSGGGLDLGQLDMFGLPGEFVAVGAAALVALGVLSN